MATADKLDYLLETKNQIKEAIAGKGVSVTDADSFRSYASKIGQIEAGNINEYFVEEVLFEKAEYVLSKMIKKLPFNFDTRNVTDMAYMFSEGSNLEILDLSNFDTSKVTNMSFMFRNCSSLTKLDLSGFDTSKVTRIPFMFHNCQKLKSLDLSNFNTSNVTDMSYLFASCRKLEKIEGILDLSKVTNVQYMFSSCTELTEVRIKNLNRTGLTVATCAKLSHDSLIYLINNLVDSSGQTSKSLTLGTDNLAKLTDEEKAIATEKNWTLA